MPQCTVEELSKDPTSPQTTSAKSGATGAVSGATLAALSSATGAAGAAVVSHLNVNDPNFLHQQQTQPN